MNGSLAEFRTATVSPHATLALVVVLKGRSRPVRVRIRPRRRAGAVAARRAVRSLSLTVLCVVAVASGALVGRLGGREPRFAAWAVRPEEHRVLPAWEAPRQAWPLALVPATEAPQGRIEQR